MEKNGVIAAIVKHKIVALNEKLRTCQISAADYSNELDKLIEYAYDIGREMGLARAAWSVSTPLDEKNLKKATDDFLNEMRDKWGKEW